MPRILIADDNIVSAMELTESLAGLDCQVVGVTTSGQEAIEMISELNPDLVLMEMNMPGQMDEVTAAERIKAARDVPIVFVNGDAHKKIRVRLYWITQRSHK